MRENSPRKWRTEGKELSPVTTNSLAYREHMEKEYEGNPLIRKNKDALLLDTLQSMDLHYNTNNSMLGIDECGKCWPRFQKHQTSPLKINWKTPKLSKYQKDYTPFKSQDQLLKIEPELYSSHYFSSAMPYTTTHRVSILCNMYKYQLE